MLIETKIYKQLTSAVKKEIKLNEILKFNQIARSGDEKQKKWINVFFHSLCFCLQASLSGWSGLLWVKSSKRQINLFPKQTVDIYVYNFSAACSIKLKRLQTSVCFNSYSFLYSSLVVRSLGESGVKCPKVL